MLWLWTGLYALTSLALGIVLIATVLYYYLRWRYLQFIVRIFQERPLFVVPRGQQPPGAEDVRFPTTGGLMLQGCYLRTTARERRGVVLFGLEFGSNRWACAPYCEHLLADGYDVFAFEPRAQGDSDRSPDYEPMQWVTDYEVADARAALEYLKRRPDADLRGVGFFGISKGGGAGLLAAADDPYVRCFVTDGVFGTYTTVVPYMQKWFSIYNGSYILQAVAPAWYYGLVGKAGLRRVAQERNCHFPHLEWAMKRLAPRPLLMIHGAADTYIKPEMAQALFRRARRPKEFWLVDGAKHNQALHVAPEEYRARVLEFLNKHLAACPQPAPPAGRSERLHAPATPNGAPGNGAPGSPHALARIV